MSANTADEGSSHYYGYYEVESPTAEAADASATMAPISQPVAETGEENDGMGHWTREEELRVLENWDELRRRHREKKEQLRAARTNIDKVEMDLARANVDLEHAYSAQEEADLEKAEAEHAKRAAVAAMESAVAEKEELAVSERAAVAKATSTTRALEKANSKLITARAKITAHEATISNQAGTITDMGARLAVADEQVKNLLEQLAANRPPSPRNSRRRQPVVGPRPARAAIGARELRRLAETPAAWSAAAGSRRLRR